VNRWDPIAAKMINAYPTPTGTARLNNYLANVVQNQRWNQGDVRVDHQISSKDNFFARYRFRTPRPSSRARTRLRRFRVSPDR
jgi:hypothetical protein